MELTKIKTGSTYEDRYSYSRAVVLGDWILLANTAGRNYRTREMPPTCREQAEQAMRNVEGALAAAGATLADVVRIRVAIPDPADVPQAMTYLGERFRGIDPVLTLTCTPLAGEYRFEIEATAVRGAGAAEAQRLTVTL